MHLHACLVTLCVTMVPSSSWIPAEVHLYRCTPTPVKRTRTFFGHGYPSLLPCCGGNQSMATFLGLNLALQVVGSRCCTKSPTLQDIFSINTMLHWLYGRWLADWYLMHAHNTVRWLALPGSAHMRAIKCIFLDHKQARRLGQKVRTVNPS